MPGERVTCPGCGRPGTLTHYGPTEGPGAYPDGKRTWEVWVVTHYPLPGRLYGETCTFRQWPPATEGQ